MAQDTPRNPEESTPSDPQIPHDQSSQQTISRERGDGTEGLVNNGSEQLDNASRQGIVLDTAPLHLHSAAKGDEDYINGDDDREDMPSKPERDKL